MKLSGSTGRPRIREAVSRQPCARAVVDFLAEAGAELTRQRRPARLPPVRPALRPDGFKRRVGG